jgi:hypothetical protein
MSAWKNILSELQVVVSWLKKCSISKSLEGKDLRDGHSCSSVEEESGNYCLIMAITRRVAANILNKQSRTENKGWSSSLGVGRGANNPSP